jgi:hypothetical protein
MAMDGTEQYSATLKRRTHSRDVTGPGRLGLRLGRTRGARAARRSVCRPRPSRAAHRERIPRLFLEYRVQALDLESIRDRGQIARPGYK